MYSGVRIGSRIVELMVSLALHPAARWDRAFHMLEIRQIFFRH